MRLIDADAFKEYCQTGMKQAEMEGIYTTASLKQAKATTEGFCMDIDEQPTIDAVAVVRCKDCKHSREVFEAGNGYVACNIFGYGVSEYGFCYMAERR